MAKLRFQDQSFLKMALLAAGPGMTVSLTADTTLTVAAHAGRILLCK